MYLDDWVKVLETESTLEEVPEVIGKVYQVDVFYGEQVVIKTEIGTLNMDKSELEIVPEIARAEYIIKEVIKGTDEETQEGYFKYLSQLFDWEFIEEYTDRIKYLENRVKELEG